jgi:hypothetical protein
MPGTTGILVDTEKKSQNVDSSWLGDVVMGKLSRRRYFFLGYDILFFAVPSPLTLIRGEKKLGASTRAHNQNLIVHFPTCQGHRVSFKR